MKNIKARHIGSKEINGRPVGFFTPPHGEPDFLWVEVEALAGAFLPEDAARRMLEHCQNFDRDNRPVVAAQNGSSIVTIMCHAMAQGLCGAIDQLLHDYQKSDDEWGGGPAETAYCVAAGQMMADHWPLPIVQLAEAFHNQGGPFMRGGK
ncbi:hypothetical protein [Shinella sp. HZN7]|uniref:hypothetical protein n=1 Tax=Shinella sp. (strain HZN7) TaxID=879274 RepID=UPI0007DAA34E|nr:hypothetical protein [Shinella sp. HZN7]ANH03598.1 hypothetical protein shn_05835 [Shinella sp. HZN7]